MTDKNLIEQPTYKPLHKKIGFWIPALVSTLIFLFAPNDVLTRFPVFNSFVDFMSSIIPAIDGWRQGSLSPEKTALLVSWNWFTLPYLIIYYYRNGRKVTKDKDYFKRLAESKRGFYKYTGFRRIFMILASYVIMGLLLMWLPFYSETHHCRGFCIGQSPVLVWAGNTAFLYTMTAIFVALILTLINFKKLVVAGKSE